MCRKVVPCLSSSWRKRSLKSTRSRWHGRRWSPADVLWRRRRRQRSHCAIFWLRSAWERRCRAHRRLGRLSFLPWRGNRQLRTRKISMEGVDNQALTEKAVQSRTSPRVSEFGQHCFTRTSWNLIFWVFWSLSVQNIWYFVFTKVNGCRVICAYSRGSRKWPFFTKL